MNEIQKAKDKWEAQECRIMGWPTPEQITKRKAAIQAGWDNQQRLARLVIKPQPVEVLEWIPSTNTFSPGII